MFNTTISNLQLIELPLLDRAYTWSNNRLNPTLERIDRAFFNLAWDEQFPNTTLSSLTRFSSDHVPLMDNISSHIPRSRLFRFESFWTLHPACKRIVTKAWTRPLLATKSDHALASAIKRTRANLKSWSRTLRPVHQREIDCKLVIDRIDRLEEKRTLSRPEASLRIVIVTSLQRAIRQKVLFWKQRGKVKATIDGDKNTKKFHVSASQRFRKNNIAILEDNWVEFSAHDNKAAILHNFFRNLLGTKRVPAWHFTLADLYPMHLPQLRHLDSDFSTQEIKDAFFQMNVNASPGPDGLGPGFCRRFWHNIKLTILPFFDDFANLRVDVERFNRAHMILLPKNVSARTPENFRPISLQNCPPKAIAKVITNRIKPIIPLLVHGDPSGFISGRCIAENFIYAADLLSACHIRKAPTIVLKLDFHKAFDSINWDSLLVILLARGFPPKSIHWIRTLLISSRTVVVLNGNPGPWIKCQNGLRQGDPMSPYLFLIIADLLQRLILRAFSPGQLCHPIYTDCPPTVL